MLGLRDTLQSFSQNLIIDSGPEHNFARCRVVQTRSQRATFAGSRQQAASF
jgi:hypothetical protein